MKKALFVIWSLERGGAEKFLASLLENFNMSEFQPTLLCLNWKGEWAKAIEEKGIRVIEYNKKDGLDLKVFFKLLTHIREEKYDVVNTHLYCADCYGRIAAFLCGVPVVVSTAQNVDLWKKWHHLLVDRILGIKTDALIAVSEAVKEFYNKKCGYPSEKISIIYNSVDISKFDSIKDVSNLKIELNIKPNDFVLACIARLEPQKGHTYLIDALELLRKKIPYLKVLIVGKGTLQEEIIAYAKHKNVSDMAFFLGQRNDIPEILKLSNALILPSLFEGLPVCVLEAMAAGKPVIATDVGGTKELAIDKETAFIIPPKNVEAITESVEKLYLLPDRGQSMGKAGRNVVEKRFSIESACRKTIELFNNLLKSKGL